MRPGSRARWKLAVPACALALLAAGCGSSGTSPSGAASSPASPAESPTPSVQDTALCADADALRASVNKLTHVTTGPGVVNELTADVNDVKAALTTFTDHAGNHWQTQTAALNSALGKLKTAVSNLAASPSTQTGATVATALGEVTTAARNLLSAVSSRCPSGSPSPSM